jgi:2-iminobutanoate/2-iminopropanoate deaminase
MKEIVFTEKAPKPIGPYSQAVRASGLVFLSGQLGIDPATGRLVAGAGAQTRQAMANLRNILEKSGLSLQHVIKATIYVTDMSAFKEVNEAYAETFPSEPPARSTVGVAALPLAAKVEIELIAVQQD